MLFAELNESHVKSQRFLARESHTIFFLGENSIDICDYYMCVFILYKYTCV